MRLICEYYNRGTGARGLGDYGARDWGQGDGGVSSEKSSVISLMEGARSGDLADQEDRGRGTRFFAERRRSVGGIGEDQFLLAGQFVVDAFDDDIQMLGIMHKIQGPFLAYVARVDGENGTNIEGVHPFAIKGIKQREVLLSDAGLHGAGAAADAFHQDLYRGAEINEQIGLG